MSYFVYTMLWMSWNIFLAFVPLIFVILILKYNNLIVRFTLSVFWLLFFPNTLYLLTDLRHIPKILNRLTGIELWFSLFMFFVLVVLGILTYIYSIYPLEKQFFKKREFNNLLLFGLNLLTSFGLILGRVYRFNSWDAFTKPYDILYTSFRILTNINSLLFILIFSICSTLVYIFYLKIFHNNN